MKRISIVTGSFNEEGNVEEWFQRVLSVVATLNPEEMDYEIIWVDNASTDQTVMKVKEWCQRNSRIKLIVNARNFGPIRSPFHGLMQARGDAAIYLASDLQDIPELIPQFIEEWQRGFEVVAGVYKTSTDHFLMKRARKMYYKVMETVSEGAIRSFTGFGLYSRRVLDLLRENGGQMPYVRGLVGDFGLPFTTIAYDKPQRKYGVSKNDLLGLIDQALLGLTSMSRAPIRCVTLLGLASSIMGFIMAFIYLMMKLIHWDSMNMGTAPLLMGGFLFSSVQIFMLGLIGEYVASIHMNQQKRPWVIEKERLNFEKDEPI